jgi:hypothetical protein
VRNIEKDRLKTFQLQANMKSNHSFKKALNTQSMKRENTRLKELWVLENTRLHKNRLEESQLGRSKEKDCLMKFQLLANMRLGQRLLKGHSIRCTKRETRRLKEQLDQVNMKHHKNKLEESQLVRNTENDSQKMFLLQVNMKSNHSLLKVLNTQCMRRENTRSKEQSVQVSTKLPKNRLKVSQSEKE